MWAAGTGPLPLTQALLDKLKASGAFDAERAANGGAAAGGTDAVGRAAAAAAIGRIGVDPWLRVVGAPAGSLIALGDAALCRGADGEPLPQTAQVAAQQGAFAARLLNRCYDLRGSGARAAPLAPGYRTRSWRMGQWLRMGQWMRMR